MFQFFKELASEAECRKVLHSIYDMRRSENRPDEEEVNKLEHALTMIHFLSKDFDKVGRFSKTLMEKPDVTDDVKNQLTKVLNFINREK